MGKIREIGEEREEGGTGLQKIEAAEEGKGGKKRGRAHRPEDLAGRGIGSVGVGQRSEGEEEGRN